MTISRFKARTADQGTRDKILEAAETLVAEQGFDRVSLREITAAAGVNLAAVHYHFGSREALIDEIISRYVAPINLERLRLLDEAEARHGENPVPLGGILDAFLRPLSTHAAGAGRSTMLFYKLLGRCLGMQSQPLPGAVLPALEQMGARFAQALRRVLPWVPEEVVFWRLHFIHGAITNTLLHSETLVRLAGGRAGNPSSAQVYGYLMTFCAAGLQAPVSPEEMDLPTLATDLR